MYIEWRFVNSGGGFVGVLRLSRYPAWHRVALYFPRVMFTISHSHIRPVSFDHTSLV